MAQKVPEDAQNLIARHIHSVAQLELLLYLRDRRGEVVTPESVGRDQKVGPDMARDLLTDLAGRGFLTEKDGGFIYDPKSPLDRQVDELAGAYNAYRVTVINLIFSKPSEGVQSFADAFRVRRDDE
ncbi:MAG: hypothetical protein KY391_03960 [Actinobacteria bacterium]|nr:hypothetical protein [Actinomycetota bacterium]